jgi:hypothetical protein
MHGRMTVSDEKASRIRLPRLEDVVRRKELRRRIMVKSGSAEQQIKLMEALLARNLGI